MRKFFFLLKWRLLVAAIALGIVTVFLYNKGSASTAVIIVLALAAVVHLVWFVYLLFKKPNK